MKTIAVFGGTFNPFHIGHYEMLKAICELDYIGTVLVMPDKIPPHKDMDFCVSDDDRIEMCRLVCEDFVGAILRQRPIALRLCQIRTPLVIH